MHHVDFCGGHENESGGQQDSMSLMISSLQLLSFADTGHRRSLKRLASQARDFGLLRAPKLLTERDLDQEVFAFARNFFGGRFGRGYGYYFWKPQIIYQELSKIAEGEVLLYLDAGCHLNPKGRTRMGEYFMWSKESESGILAFQYRPPAVTASSNSYEIYTDRQYSKREVRDFFAPKRITTPLLDSGQVASGIMFFRKCESSLTLVRQWRDSFLIQPSLFDDTLDPGREDPQFIENRHDQSVWSLLTKFYGADTVSAYERWIPKFKGETQDWSTLENFPIWAKRDLDQSKWLNRLRKGARIAVALKKVAYRIILRKPE